MRIYLAGNTGGGHRDEIEVDLVKRLKMKRLFSFHEIKNNYRGHFGCFKKVVSKDEDIPSR